MHAIKAICNYMQKNRESDGSRTLSELAAALAEEQPFPLGKLSEIDYKAFELALDLLRDWRLDRHYAARIKLFDTVLNEIEVADPVRPTEIESSATPA
jgi:hypothetical protein